MLLVIYFDRYIKNLVKQLRNHQVPYIKLKYSDINTDINAIVKQHHVSHVIIAGSQQRILRLNHKLAHLDAILHNPAIKRIVGICFGWQYIAKVCGGQLAEGRLFKGVKQTMLNRPLWFDHHDIVTWMPPSWNIFDTTTSVDGQSFINAAASNNGRLVGFQFHPENNDDDFKVFVLPLLYGAIEQ